MACRMFQVAYDVVTPESAEHGDYAESGFLNWQGLRVTPRIGEPTPDVEMTLREALRLVGGPFEDSGSWLSMVDPVRNFRNGEEETRSLHPPRSISDASYKRLKHLLGVK